MTKLSTHSALKRQTKTPLSKKKLQFDLEPVDELDMTSEVRPEVSPDLPHVEKNANTKSILKAFQ